MDPHRVERVSEALREELAEIIAYEMSDPRLAGVTVLEVQVGPDLKRAHVVVQASRADALEALEHARQYLRRELAARLSMYRVPELFFEAQTPDSPAARVDELLARLRKKDPGSREK